MWSDNWIGLPYAELGRGPKFDCLGLFLALQKVRHGRLIADPMCRMSEARGEAVLGGHRPLWQAVGEARQGDAVLFLAGRAWHIGYALDDRQMLHIEDDAGSVIEPFETTRWGQRLEGKYRFVG